MEGFTLEEINLEKKLILNNFDISFIPTTHSIPEPTAIVIKTTYGSLLHTADWKIDHSPTLGDSFSKEKFEKLGNDGLLALIGDSTNANVPGKSESESDVRDELTSIFSRFSNRIVVPDDTFIKLGGTTYISAFTIEFNMKTHKTNKINLIRMFLWYTLGIFWAN